MLRIVKTVSLAFLALFGFIALNAAMAPSLQAQGETQIEGTINGMNTVDDPPILAVTTSSGTNYLLRAPNFSSVAGAQIGGRFRATGAASGETFVASSIQLSDANAKLPPQPVAGGRTATITGADTESDPPRLMVSVDGGAPMLLMLPGAANISDIQLDATISFNGSQQGNEYRVNDWVILSYPSGGDNDNNASADHGDDNDNT